MRSAVTVLDAALSFDLTTLATFKDTLKIKPSDKTRDDALLRCIRQATGAINKACGRPFALEKVSERFLFDSCEQTEMLVLNRRPVVPPIETITEGTTILAGDKFDLFDPEHGLLLRAPPPWIASASPGLVIVYTGGYALLDSLPDEIELACLKLATDYYRSEGRDTTVQSVNVPDVEAVTYGGATADAAAMGPLPDEVRGLLRPYLKVI